MLKLGFVSLILALVLTVATQPASAAVLGQSSQTGIFGEVIKITGDHPRAVAGEIDITLNTAKGPVDVTANPGTMIRVPGLEQPLIEDIPLGSSVAVLASNGQAASILVKPVRPVRSRHFTGIVTAVEEDGIVEIEDDRGRKISAPLATGPSVLKPGYMVTAVLEQDLNSGAILITGLDQALDNLKRLQAALERAEKDPATGKLAALRQRLNENGNRHLTMAQNVHNRTDSSLQGQLKERFAAAQNAYGQGMSRFKAGRPSATVSGIVTSIDQQRNLIMVQPAGSSPVQVIVDGDTAIRFQGRAIPFSRLDVANRVQVRYGLESRTASRISISAGAILDKTAAKVLLATKDPGEITGSILDIERFPGELPQITLRDKDSQDTVTLNMSTESVVLRNGAPSTVNRDLLDTEVTAIFHPDSLELIELDSQASDGDNKPIRGVIHRFVAKNLPGNLTILTRDGTIRTFSRTTETVVRRNGRRVSVNEVRLGDVVRANTRIVNASGDAAPVLEVLSLSSPPLAPIHGTITGITNAGQGSMRATITTNKLDIIDILVDADTQVVQKGKSIGLDGLTLGQRIVNGAYQPITRKVDRLTVQPPRAASISGEITLVEEYLSSVTIQPRQGGPVILIFPQTKPPTITRQNKGNLNLSDLKAGDRVRAAFYDPATNRVLRLVLAPVPDLNY